MESTELSGVCMGVRDAVERERMEILRRGAALLARVFAG